MAYESRLSIVVDSRSAEQQARDTEKALEALERAGIQASASTDKLGDRSKRAARDVSTLGDKTKGAAGDFNRMRGAATAAYGAITGLIGAAAVRGITKAADAFTQMQGQLQLVEGSAEAAAKQYDALLSAANQTRSDMESTVTLYTRLKRGTDELNLSSEQLIALTETINNSFVVSGASAEDAANATRQLAQGLASGALRGDEFNSVMENAPRLGRAIAEALGMSVGELRDFAAEGRITSRVIAESLLSQMEAINDEAAIMPRTVGQAMTQFSNDVQDAVGRADVSPFIDAIDDLRAIVTDPGFQQAMIDTASAIAKIVGLGAEGAREFATFGKQLGTLAAQATGASNELLDIEEKIQRLESMRNSSFMSRSGLFDFGEGLDTYISDEDIDRYIAGLKAQRAEIVQGVNDGGSDEVIELPPMQITPPDLGQSEKAIKAQIAAMERAMQAYTRLRSEFDPLGSAVSQFNDQVAQLDSLLVANKITQNDYGQAVRLLSDRLQEAATDADPYLSKLKAINEQYVEANSLSKLFAQQEAAQGMGGAAGNIARQGIGNAIGEQALSGKPSVGGLDPMHSGAFGELARIQQEREALGAWYDERIAMYQQYREMEVENAAHYDEVLRQLRAQRSQDTQAIEQQERAATLAGSAQMFGGLAQMSAMYAGDAAGITKALVGFQQVANIAQMLGYLGVGTARQFADLPWYAAIGTATSVGAQIGSLMSMVKGVETPAMPSFNASSYAGAFDKGGRIPAGQWGIAGEYGPEIIQGPANVTSRKDTAGMMGGDVDVSVQIVNNGTAKTADAKMQRLSDRKFVIQVMQEDLQSGDKRSYTNQFAAKHALTRKGT
jgi:tape measure domain-containing protein